MIVQEDLNHPLALEDRVDFLVAVVAVVVEVVEVETPTGEILVVLVAKVAGVEWVGKVI